MVALSPEAASLVTWNVLVADLSDRAYREGASHAILLKP